MNYYSPYYVMAPINSMMRPSLFSSLRAGFRRINFNSILNGTQRTLNIINQAIPLVKQATPVFKNARTMFKVMNEFKRINTPRTNNSSYQNIHVKNDEIKEYSEGPTFFI